LPISQVNTRAFKISQEVKKAFLNYVRLIRKRLELLLLTKKLRVAKGRAEINQHKKRKRRTQQEMLLLKSEIRSAKERVGGALEGRAAPQPASVSELSALPDFVIIGAKKCGTTFLYDILTRHPHVDAAAAKELHYFNGHFDEGIDWYRQYFPQRRWKDGRRIITGEATPYLHHLHVPERMAEVIPQARLLVLLRNPVDRAYSAYQHMVRKRWHRKGWENRTFEEAIEAEKAWLLGEGKEEEISQRKDRTSLGSTHYWYLSRGIYIDQLLRWSKFFSKEQLLVVKSEDLFERMSDTLRDILGFLDLPDWEPVASESVNARNKGHFEQGMDPVTRRRLEEYFEPHNRRLYEYTGVDFGW
jgi:hypothetical protein